ncbi:response regulator [Marivita sp. XM-24bin2]|uniref:response regulator n=1 Tax=Marivita sp. XM-24bin2 TaxID=2133951 RepID=UPI0025C018F4|nr:response regulator [Marivita sp. XM-24bin2]
MILEDEVLVAFDLAGIVEDEGCEVVGPYHDVPEALAALEDCVPDLAILDVNLGSNTSEPVAQKLETMKVPFAFVTGYSSGKAKVPARFPEAPCLPKPVQPREIVRLMRDELERSDSDG